MNEIYHEEYDIKVLDYDYVTTPAVKEPHVDFYLAFNGDYRKKVKNALTKDESDADIAARMDESGNVRLIACFGKNETDISEILDTSFLEDIMDAIADDTQILPTDHVTACTFIHSLRADDKSKNDKSKKVFPRIQDI